MTRSCNFCFTWNNYTEDSISVLTELKCKYICFGKEVGKSGTKHLQGVVVFANALSHTSVCKKLKGAHVEACKGSITQNETYCKKDGEWIERGIKPMDQKEKGEKGKEYYANMLQLAREDRIHEIDPQAQLVYGQALRRERDEASESRVFEDTETKMKWYYGETGTGKSYTARKEHKDDKPYFKMCNKWWDGYRNQDVVIIEDFDKKHDVLCHHLKIWADRYSFLAEYKGGAKHIRPKLIIVTSNWHPSNIWSNPEDLEPILRRFELVQFGEPPSQYAPLFNPPKNNNSKK